MLPPRLRNSALLCGLFLGWACFLYAARLTGPPDRAPLWLHLLIAFSGALWSGGLHALPILLAAWGALSEQPLVRRLPNSLAIGSALGLCLVWRDLHFNGSGTPDVLGAFSFLATVYLASFCVLLPVRLRWSIGAAGEMVSVARIGVRRLLLWTLYVGMLIGLARATLPVWPPPPPFGWPFGWHEFLFYPLKIAGLGVPLALSAIGLVLGERHRGRFGACLLLVAVVVAVIVARRYMAIPGGGAPPEHVWDVVEFVIGEVLGFVGTTLASLLVIRKLGYRLNIRSPTQRFRSRYFTLG